MEYREFVCAAIETMNQKEGKNGIQAREHRAVKNNGKIRVGLLLQETGSNLFPTIYLEEYYEKFQKGETLEQIVSEISQLYQKIKAKNIIDVDSFFNLESWKNKLGIKVIKTEKNRELLEEIPHLDVLDLSLTFYVILDRQCEGSATMQITNEYMRQWNLETEELYEMAMRSAVRLLPAEFCSLPDMIRRITGIEVEAIRGMQRECQMYVLTNSSKIQGAACMFYPHVLEMIGEILKEDFYILPALFHQFCDIFHILMILQQRSVIILFDTFQNRLWSSCQQNHISIFFHFTYILTAHCSTAAAGNNRPTCFLQLNQKIRLKIPEILFSVLFKNLRNTHPLTIRDEFIHFHNLHVKPFSQSSCHRRFSSSHKSDQYDIIIT